MKTKKTKVIDTGLKALSLARKCGFKIAPSYRCPILYAYNDTATYFGYTKSKLAINRITKELIACGFRKSVKRNSRKEVTCETYRKNKVSFSLRYDEESRETRIDIFGPKNAKYVSMNYYD
jgi:hypothetical protein